MFLADTLYRPPVSIAFVVVVVALAITACVFAFRRERAPWSALLRIIGLAGLAWLLLGPSQSQPGKSANDARPRLSILIDTSASMAEVDSQGRDGEPLVSRLDALRQSWLSEERLEALRQNADIQLIAFDEQTRAAAGSDLLATGESTHLYQAISQADSDLTLILSDGHDTSRSSVTPDTTIAGRLYAVPVGTTRSAPDLSIQAWTDSDRLFEDQSTTLTAVLAHRGFAGQQAIVELLHNGERAELRTVTLDQPSTTLRFDISPPLETGRTVQAHHYTARVRLAQGEEAYTDNNAEDVFVQVSRGRIRVLLLEGEPYWDTRSLARLIGSHPRFDLTAVFGFGDQRKTRVLGQENEQDTEPAAALSRYDIIVLGRRVDRLVDRDFAKRLDQYTRNGGAVVFARGRPFDPSSVNGQAALDAIDPISPVAWGEPVVAQMRVKLGQGNSPRGPLADLQDQSVLSNLPGMIAATRIDGRKTASLVLLEQSSGADTPAMAALTTLRVGSGVSMAVLTEGLWRWELLPGVAADSLASESVYGVFWIRALQWLASGGEFLPGQNIAIEADRLALQPGERVTLRVSTRYVETQGLNLRLIASDAQGNTHAVPLAASNTPGSYTASFTPDTTGVVTLSLTTPRRDDLIDPDRPLSTRIAVIDRSPERRDTSAKPDLLKQLTEPTGGRCLGLDEVQPILDDLQSLQAARGAQDVVDYDFNTLPAFAWIAGFFGLHWILRRRSGLR